MLLLGWPKTWWIFCPEGEHSQNWYLSFSLLSLVMLIFSFDMFAPTIKISFQCSNLGPYNLEVDAISFICAASMALKIGRLSYAIQATRRGLLYYVCN